MIAILHLGDVTKINGAEIEPVDVITFGSPCQDLSVAGKREGMKHSEWGDEETTRSGLFMEAVRIIREMRAATNGLYPTVAIWENVPGAYSSNNGEDFRAVLEELSRCVEPKCTIPRPPKKWEHSGLIALDGGSLAWRLMDAQFWGVPQRRKRLCALLYFDEHRGSTSGADNNEAVVDSGALRCAGEILFERQGLPGHPEQSIPPWEGIANDPSESFGECYTLQMREGCSGGGKGPLIREDQSATLSTHQTQTLF